MCSKFCSETRRFIASTFNNITKCVDGGSGGSSLEILNVDPCIEENGKSHMTSNYKFVNDVVAIDELPILVIRRGQEFYLEIQLNRKYKSNLDKLSILCKIDGVQFEDILPTHSQFCTISPVHNADEEIKGAWQATLESVNSESIKIKIKSPPSLPIGKWKISIKPDRNILSDPPDLQCYIIFNPWCPEDPVYIENESERQEYILEDTGLIWRGNAKQMQPTMWKYSQFEENILDCAFYLMTNIAKINYKSWYDPVEISRGLSAAVNANDDNGVLMGNWSDDYADGVSPTEWLGSQKILQKYWRDKKPVKYGQCWVFAGVFATVCRALGLPCRVVTNYKSAHDTHGNLTLDFYYDTDGNHVKDKNTDTIWNFHVWNEIWMERADIGENYGGWQAIDATPQERGEGGKFCCGPASVRAIKNGELNFHYDSKFIFAEVNADIIHWVYNPIIEKNKILGKNLSNVGQKISTKTVGAWMREDITHLYKNPDLSIEDRESMLRALSENETSYDDYIVPQDFKDVSFSVKLRGDIIIGNPIRVVLSMQNNSEERVYNVSAIVRVESKLYTGRNVNYVKLFKVAQPIEPGAHEEVPFVLAYDDYKSYLMSQSAFAIVTLAKVEDTDFEYFSKKDFRLRKPNIDIEMKSKAIVGEPLVINVSFKNPLPISLVQGQFIADGPGLHKQMKIKLTDDIKPDSVTICSFSMTPESAGPATITVKFNSEQLDDVQGYSTIIVKDGIIIY